MIYSFIVFMMSFLMEPSSSINGRVLAEDGKPIKGVHVFFRGHLQLGTETNEDGFFSIENTEEKFPVLVFSLTGYEDKEVVVKKLNKDLTITLKEESNRVILQDLVITANNKKIEFILKQVKKRYYTNTYIDKTVYRINGTHLSKEKNDTIIFLKSPFSLGFEGYPKLNANSKISFYTHKNTIIKKGKTYYTIAYNSNIFLVNIFKWLDVKNLNFITKPNKYIYQMSETENSYILYFTPKKESPFMYYGEMSISKENFALEKFNAKLTFNKKNQFSIISLSKKYPGSTYYTESREINVDFIKKDNSSKMLIKHIVLSENIGRAIKNSSKRILYSIETNLNFDEIQNPYKEKAYNLLDHIYIEAEKNKGRRIE